LAELEAHYRVSIITQNIDDLHERAGSSSVLHLHGIITKAQSSLNPRLVYPVQGTEIRMGEKCELGSQLRPHVVWFGEAVPNMEKAARLCGQADTFLVIGTSLQVYPAAGLIHYVPAGVTIYIVDPQASALTADPAAICLNERAAEGVPRLVEQLVRSGG
jgi:NAD-dependent deacetylase